MRVFASSPQGYYFTGDGALTDSDGHFQITGRVDDVINVSGHRIGTAEIEDILVTFFEYFQLNLWMADMMRKKINKIK